jgi:hypothetical protein
MITDLLSEFQGFEGVFPLDYLPQPTTAPAAYVINTHTSIMPGEHWVAVVFSGDGTSEYFDSFGLPPMHPEITQFMQSHSRSGHWNPHALQGVTARTCGLYCVLYVTHRLAGHASNEFLRLFTDDSLVNDLRVCAVALGE